MEAFKCDNCNQFFEVKDEDRDKDGDHFTFKMEAGEWAVLVAVARIIPPVSEESPEHGKEKDTYHIDKIEALDGSDIPDALKGLLGGIGGIIAGHVHKAGEPRRVKADLCGQCRKVVMKLVTDEYLKEKVEEETSA